jgi:hypothetical protein
VFLDGLMTVIFGTLWTAWLHAEAVAWHALLPGEYVIIRGELMLRAWVRFLSLNGTFSIYQRSVRRHASDGADRD